MSTNGKPAPAVLWTVQFQIPVPLRLARRASKTALEKWLARAVVGAIQTMPPEFIVQSAEKVKADIKKAAVDPRLVGADGRPYRM
jgi:hypothetical protein